MDRIIDHLQLMLAAKKAPPEAILQELL